MNNYTSIGRSNRNQTLILVEGEVEERELIHLMLKVFPQIPIQMENVHFYSANIYYLFNAIVREYGDDWYCNGDEIDIPLLISIRDNIYPRLDKRDYVNIFLFFDYERHAPQYDDSIIQCMQEHFSDATEDGMLFLNYPMIESYMHMEEYPCDNYITSSVSVSCQPGSEYKRLVRDNSATKKYFDLYFELKAWIFKRANQLSSKEIEQCIERLFHISNDENLIEQIENIFYDFNLSAEKVNQLKYYIYEKMAHTGNLSDGISWWNYLRSIFVYVINCNIRKGFQMMHMFNDSEPSVSLLDAYDNLDYSDILRCQINSSRDSNCGIIYILCTCMFFIGEYKFYRMQYLE